MDNSQYIIIASVVYFTLALIITIIRRKKVKERWQKTLRFFSKWRIFSYCATCGNKISMFENRFYLDNPDAPKTKVLYVCEHCHKQNLKTAVNPDKSVSVLDNDGSVQRTVPYKGGKEKLKTFAYFLVLIIIAAVIFYGTRNAGQDSRSSTCKLCHDRSATNGNYCSSCYDSLSNIADAYD